MLLLFSLFLPSLVLAQQRCADPDLGYACPNDPSECCSKPTACCDVNGGCGWKYQCSDGTCQNSECRCASTSDCSKSLDVIGSTLYCTNGFCKRVPPASPSRTPSTTPSALASRSPSPSNPPTYEMSYIWYSDDQCSAEEGRLTFTSTCQSANFYGQAYYGIGVCTSTSAYALQFYTDSSCTSKLYPNPIFNKPGVCGDDPVGNGDTAAITCVARSSGGGGGGGSFFSATGDPTPLALGVGLGLVALIILVAAAVYYFFCRKSPGSAGAPASAYQQVPNAPQSFQAYQQQAFQQQTYQHQPMALAPQQAPQSFQQPSFQQTYQHQAMAPQQPSESMPLVFKQQFKGAKPWAQALSRQTTPSYEAPIEQAHQDAPGPPALGEVGEEASMEEEAAEEGVSMEEEAAEEQGAESMGGELEGGA